MAGTYPVGLKFKPRVLDGNIVLSDVSSARLNDLARRREGAALTNAEKLALAVLAGGALGEESLQVLIDAAQEEYANGTYRVPVRVVADWNRTLIVLTPRDTLSQADAEYILNGIANNCQKLAAGAARVMIIPAGAKLEVYESAAGGVEVRAQGDQG